MNKFKCECGREYALVPVNPMTTRLMGLAGHDAKTFEAAWAGDNAATLTRQADPGYTSRTVETPARAPSVESDVKVPLLQAVIGGAFVGAGTICAWLYLGWPKPAFVALGATVVSTGLAWWAGVADFKAHLWRVESFIGRDLDGDGATGKPEIQTVLSPFPVRGRDQAESTPTTTRPATPARRPTTVKPTGDSKIQIRAADKRRSARIVKLSDVWEFLKVSYATGDWTRDSWQERGMSQKLWADYKEFFVGLGWWQIADRPTLDLALRRFCYSGNERTGERTNERS